MKLLIEVQDNKASFVMELLRSFTFVKTKPYTEQTDALVEEIKEAVRNVKSAKSGKLKAMPTDQLLNEL